MNTVTDIGQVHDYERYSKRESVLKKHYLYNDQLRGWFVRRLGWTESNQEGGLRTIKTRWLIRGYLALSDEGESEKQFDALLDELADAFRADDTLNGAVSTTWVGNQAGLQNEDQGPVLFASVLCHAARLTLTTEHHELGPGES